MKAKLKIDKIFILIVLLILVLINYQIVTIILKGNVFAKYSRDVLLMMLLSMSVFSFATIRIEKYELFILLLALLSVIAILKAPSLSLGILSFRKYFFPLAMLVVISRFDWYNRDNRIRFCNFLLLFAMILSVWGIFQAFVLGDSFLKRLGYYTAFSHGYGREMLRNSFYFGGLGIQRVVSTLSNSNECGLILGACLLLLIGNYSAISIIKKNVMLIIIFSAYLLTFSRSNFLALAVVSIFMIFPYIPHKKGLIYVISFIVLCGIIYNFLSPDGNYIQKIIKWISESINLTDLSVAGRSVRWSNASELVLNNFWGIGFGYVGSIARDSGNAYIECENSYLAIALDMGILGMAIYFSFLLILQRSLYRFRNGSKIRKDKDGVSLCTCCMATVLYFLVAMLFSNYIQDMEAMCLMYLNVGVALGYARYYPQSASKGEFGAIDIRME